jgi:preprotein translocase subunit YajC
MEVLQQIIPFIPSGAVPLVICICFYFYIQSKRKETAQKRDAAHDDLDKRISLLELKVSKLDELNLEAKLAEILTELKWIKDNIKK